MKIKTLLTKTDPVLKLGSLIVLSCCIVAVRDDGDVWTFFALALGLAWVAGLIRPRMAAVQRRKKMLLFLLFFLALGLWRPHAVWEWLPLSVVMRFASLMLLGWTFIETTQSCALAASVARLPLPRFVAPLLVLSSGIVSTVRTEAFMTSEALRIKRSELPRGQRLRGLPRLLLRCVFVFVLRVFLRADELTEVAALRGLEAPSWHGNEGPYRPAPRDVSLCSGTVLVGLLVVVC